MSLLDRLEVPAAKSRASTRATSRPRVAASSAAPVPVEPPPMTTTSKVSERSRSRSAVRCSALRTPGGDRVGHGVSVPVPVCALGRGGHDGLWEGAGESSEGGVRRVRCTAARAFPLAALDRRGARSRVLRDVRDHRLRVWCRGHDRGRAARVRARRDRPGLGRGLAADRLGLGLRRGLRRVRGRRSQRRPPEPGRDAGAGRQPRVPVEEGAHLLGGPAPGRVRGRGARVLQLPRRHLGLRGVREDHPRGARLGRQLRHLRHHAGALLRLAGSARSWTR